MPSMYLSYSSSKMLVLYSLLLSSAFQITGVCGEHDAGSAGNQVAATPSARHSASSNAHIRRRTAKTRSSKASSTTPVVTKFQGFDSMPTGKVNPSSTYNGLQFTGWSVQNIDVAGSYFNAESPSNALRLVGNSGTIAAAPGLLMNTVQYYFGCSKGDAAASCQFANIYPGGSIGDSGRPNTTFNIFYDGSKEPENTLIQAEGFFQNLGPNVTFAFSAAHEDVNLYIDSFVYVETGCT